MIAAKRRVAVLGLGSIGLRHLNALRRLPGVDAIAVPARQRVVDNGLTASTLAEAAGLGATACVIATNTGRHLDDARAALELGLDVLVEKPLALDASEARLLRHHAEQSTARLFVGYVLRFSSSLNCFRDRLSQIGRLHAVRIECQSYLPDWRPDRPYRESYSASGQEGGVLRDLSHEIDYAGWLFGWPTALDARVHNLGRLRIDGEETADLMWEHADGCVVSVRLDFLSRPGRRRMVAFGESGTLEWNGLENIVTLCLVDEPVAVVSVPQTADERIELEDAAFLAATDRVNSTPVDPRLATADEGFRSLAVCDAARRASAARRQAPVDYAS